MRPPPPWSIAVGIGYHKGKQKVDSTSLMHWTNPLIHTHDDVVLTTGTVHELIREDASYWKKLRSGLAIWREKAYAALKRERYGAHRSILCNFYCACVFMLCYALIILAPYRQIISPIPRTQASSGTSAPTRSTLALTSI